MDYKIINEITYVPPAGTTATYQLINMEFTCQDYSSTDVYKQIKFNNDNLIFVRKSDDVEIYVWDTQNWVDDSLENIQVIKYPTKYNDLKKFWYWYKNSNQNTDKVEMILFENTADTNVVDKSTYLNVVDVVYGRFIESINIVRPLTSFEWDSLVKFNYVYVTQLERYYFVDSFIIDYNKMYKLSLSVDVLYTYQAEIKATSGYVERTSDSTYYNRKIPDNLVSFENAPEYIAQEITKGTTGAYVDSTNLKDYNDAGATIEQLNYFVLGVIKG